jgi:two-component system sensor histidine kinase UhpB
VSLEVNQERAVLSICDDGCGFEPDVALARERDREHFGLKGIQERAEAMGGIFRLESQAGHGTTVAIEIPLAVPESQ